jgi:hypothetical protein
MFLAEHKSQVILTEVVSADARLQHRNRGQVRIGVILVGAVTLREAERLVASCEHCNPDPAISNR